MLKKGRTICFGGIRNDKNRRNSCDTYREILEEPMVQYTMKSIANVKMQFDFGNPLDLLKMVLTNMA